MKSKGFTLVELVGVFVILALIVLITVPQLIGLIKKSNDSEYQNFLETLYIAAENYVAEYDVDVNAKDQIISIEQLVESGFLKASLVNPKTNKLVTEKNASGEIEGGIRVYKDNNKYKYEILENYIGNFNGVTNKNYNKGDKVSYANKTWYVVADEQDFVTLMLSTSIGNGIYGENTNFNDSVAKQKLEEWFKSDKVIYNDFLNGAIKTDQDGYYVRLIKESEIPSEYKSTSKNLFWTMTNSDNSIVVSFYTGETKYIPGSVFDLMTGYAGHESYRGKVFETKKYYYPKYGLQYISLKVSPTKDSTTLRYGVFSESKYLSSTSSVATRDQYFDYCDSAVGIVRNANCNWISCEYAETSTCYERDIYNINNIDSSIDYIPVITVRKK